MQCPACQSELQEIDLHDLKIDLCQDGCGGIWFDRFELNRLNKIHANTLQNLFKTATQKTKTNITKTKRRCPRDTTIMQQHYHSVRKKIEVDTCPCCAGIWLDRNELDAIQNEYESQHEREEEASRFIEAAFQKILANR